MDYLKYWTPVVVVGVAFLGFYVGGDWVWLGIGTFPVLAFLDSVFPRDFGVRKIQNARLANIPIWLCTLGPVCLYFAFAWRLSVEDLNGWQIAGGILSVAWMGVIPLVPAAHELYHMRGLLPRIVGHYGHLCIFDCTRDIAHVVGHHIDVATVHDGDTAPRGKSLYAFTGRAVIESTRYSMRMECEALRKRGLHPWHLRHRVYRAALALLIFHALLHAIGGWRANLFGLAAQLISRVWVESFNYFQHYGVIRVPGAPIGRRHLWNHLHWFSRTCGFEITNHADHHLNSYQAFYKLVPHREAIPMPSVFVCFLAALIPPIWHELIIKPALKRWDAEFATPEERALAREQNRAAGWPDWQSEPELKIGQAQTVGV
ncbi:alkane 1-monooxygenase [Solimonas aquatica]|uniref:Alkane 1-monooxygenase n=1 Tax=Solimonas aquatica TaxID=489703 RepID=A0A1H9BD79_9GAMM|nr:alkane 1-monooxygenase [Solimonas aquatica]SEP86687.1 alkane 1-monooxygenase [Solimonas aquatica]